MSENVSRTGCRPFARYSFFFGIIFMICASVLGEVSMGSTVFAHVSTTPGKHIVPVDCTSATPAKPTGQSLLIVLLDRSGSLIGQPGATDPQRYSTSVTKALADLWPGKMAVIPFRLDTTTLPILGPATLSDPSQLANLKNSVQNYPIGGGTPLAPAMREALNLLQLQGTPAGSQVIIVTDGNPTGQGNNDGPHQEQEIRSSLIGQYCNMNVPVSAFGLTINSNTPDGRDANKLLTDITTGTNGSYQPVTKPEELARAVIQLYAQWLRLSFIEATVRNGNAPVSIDSSAKNVTILTFRSDSNTPVALDGPDGQLIQGVESSEDTHYIINSLSSGSGVFVPGTYTIHTSNDPDVQVYALVDSTLQIVIVTPTGQGKFFDNQPITIEAKFVDNGNDKQPAPGEATMVAKVKFIVNGVVVSSTQLPLIQNGVIFKGQTPVYRQIGTVQIEVDGTDQGIQRSSTCGVRIIPPPPPPCMLGFWRCLLLQIQQYLSQYHTQILIFGPLALLLLLLLLWWIRPSPFGVLVQGNNSVYLNRNRSLLHMLFKKSVLSSNEMGRLNFNGAQFELIFKRGRRVYIQTKRDQPAITIKCMMNKKAVQMKRGQREILHVQDSIDVARSTPATFYKQLPTKSNPGSRNK